MNDGEFWSIIDAARGGGHCQELVSNVEHALSKLAPSEIVAFDRIRMAKLRETYRWDLWGVALVVNAGCSNDGFEDFCHWLMTLGRRGYDEVLADPEVIIDWAPPDSRDVLACEELMYAALHAYSQVVDGEDMPGEAAGRDLGPAGDRWDQDRVDLLFPRVAAWVRERDA